MNVILIPDYESSLPVRKFYDDTLGSTYRCMFKTERLGATSDWAKTVYDSKWNSEELLQYHDLALSHYLHCELYRHRPELFSEPPEKTHIYIERLADNVYDNITSSYGTSAMCSEVHYAVGNMHVTYRAMFEWFIAEFNALPDIDVNVKHVTSIVWSSRDNALYISAL